MNNIRIKSLWLLAIIGIIGSLFAGCGKDKGVAQTSNEASTSSPLSPSNSSSTGHWIEQENSPVSYLAVSEATLPKLIEAEASAQAFNDVGNLYSVGKVFDVDKKTAVEVLETKGTTTKVRILEGKMKGRTGWIQSEFVKS
jgi:hypothetical protein